MSDPASDDPLFDFNFSTQPHDGFFKAVFSDPDKAAAFFRQHLPVDIVQRVEWTSLKVLPASFVKRDLQQSHSDLLFSAPFCGRETLLYLVFEHQSTPDPLMPLRLLGYVIEILLEHTREHAPPLPPVLGFVLHQGPAEWTVSTSFEDLFDLPPEAAESLLPYLPKFRHALLDLSKSDPANEETRGDLQMVLHLMKCVRERRMLEFMQWLAAGYSRLRAFLSDPLLRLGMWYGLHSEATLDVEAILQHLEGEPQLQRTVMTIAEKLIARGEVRGEARGRVEGQLKGIWIGKLHVLQELLGETVTPEETLQARSVEELEAGFRECQERYDRQFKSQR